MLADRWMPWNRKRIMRDHKATAFARLLFSAMFEDISNFGLTPARELSLDKEYVLSRINREGSVFYLQRLPQLGRALEVSAISGEAFTLPLGFRRHHGSALPYNLYGLFSQVLRDDGFPHWVKSDLVKRSPSTLRQAQCFQALRQVLMCFSKAEVEPTESQIASSNLEVEGRLTREWFPTPEANRTIHGARTLLSRFFSIAIDPSCKDFLNWESEPFGRHGPGAVAGGEKGREKWDFVEYLGHDPLLFQWREGCSSHIRRSVRPLAAKVQLVPKDFRGPRVICIEPKENQFAQQGLMRLLYRAVEQHFLTRESICFKDQTLSMRGCADRKVCTIDLKDASDLLSMRLAKLVLPAKAYRLATRYRSNRISIAGKTVRSTCFASMGNALCFPMETLIFWAIAQATVFDMGIRKRVRVFGDDIIAPIEAYDAVCQALEQCGLIVNRAKSCSITPIRESCGAYWWLSDDGAKEIDLTINRFRDHAFEKAHSWPTCIDHARAFYTNAWWKSASAILYWANWISPVPYIGVRPNMDRNIQSAIVRVPCQIPMTKGDGMEGYAGLYAWLTGNATDPIPFGTRNRVKRLVVRADQYDWVNQLTALENS